MRRREEQGEARGEEKNKLSRSSHFFSLCNKKIVYKLFYHIKIDMAKQLNFADNIANFKRIYELKHKGQSLLLTKRKVLIIVVVNS